MTKEEMSQLQSLRKEIREIQEKIEALKCKGSTRVTDKVMASTRDFPYTETSVKIEGIDIVADKKTRRQIRNKEMLLVARRQQAEEQEIRITKYINNIPDSKLRRIMEYKYVEGYTWEQIGKKMSCDRTTAEKMVAKYLHENP